MEITLSQNLQEANTINSYKTIKYTISNKTVYNFIYQILKFY